MSNETATPVDRPSTRDVGPVTLSITLWLLVTSFIFVLLRCISRIGIVRRFGWDDALIILAWVRSRDIGPWDGQPVGLGIFLTTASFSHLACPSRSSGAYGMVWGIHNHKMMIKYMCCDRPNMPSAFYT